MYFRNARYTQKTRKFETMSIVSFRKRYNGTRCVPTRKRETENDTFFFIKTRRHVAKVFSISISSGEIGDK